MIEFLFLDLDDTILDFHKAEQIALGKTLRQFGLEPTEAVCSRYSCINRGYWERLERQEISRDQVLKGRFQTLFRELGLDTDAQTAARTYEDYLSEGYYFLPGAEEALKDLARRCKLYLASNGTKKVQRRRLASAGIACYFQEIFISQEMGADKPSREYFEACFHRIPGFDARRAMIAGDSLTSDILGGQNAGMATCWINPTHRPGREEIVPDYELSSLAELDAMLQRY